MVEILSLGVELTRWVWGYKARVHKMIHKVDINDVELVSQLTQEEHNTQGKCIRVTIAKIIFSHLYSHRCYTQIMIWMMSVVTVHNVITEATRYTKLMHIALHVRHNATGKYLTLMYTCWLTCEKLSQLKFCAQHSNKQAQAWNSTANQVHILGLFENYHTSCAFVATDDHPTFQNMARYLRDRWLVWAPTKVYTFLLQPALTSTTAKCLSIKCCNEFK